MDDEIRRLKRMLIIFMGVLFWLFALVVLWTSIQIKQLNGQIRLTANKSPQIIHGIDGAQGPQGLQGMSIVGPQGVQGAQGAPGQSVTSEQIAAAVTTYLQANPVVGAIGPAGAQGLPGTDGRTLEIQVDPLTCVLKTKYTDADFWSLIAQLRKPCDPNQGT